MKTDLGFKIIDTYINEMGAFYALGVTSGILILVVPLFQLIFGINDSRNTLMSDDPSIAAYICLATLGTIIISTTTISLWFKSDNIIVRVDEDTSISSIEDIGRIKSQRGDIIEIDLNLSLLDKEGE